MAVRAIPFGQRLADWLDLLDASGFRVGVRERLVVHSLLARQAAAGQLGAHWAALLAQLAPLLCTTPKQQAQYGALLQRHVLSQGGALADIGHGAGSDAAATAAPPPRAGRRRLRRALAALLGAGLLAAALSWSLLHRAAQPPIAPVALAPPAIAPAPAPPPQAQAAVVVVPGSLPLQASQREAAAFARPLRLAALSLGALTALGLAAAAWARRRRELVLQQLRSDEDVQQHLLYAERAAALQPHPALARSVARALRQRVAGDAEALDVAATLAATVQAGGALVPRFRALKRTPEYLVLVDRRHGSDHHTYYSEALVRGLADAGVAAQIWHFEGSPDSGCWPRQSQALGQPLRTPWAELAARHAGQRLLVFADAVALVDPRSGSPRRWARALGGLGQRAWLTPLPLNAWGAAEDQVDALGFLLLPAQEGALPTLGHWLTSERLDLALAADWPLAYPALLRHDTLVWVTRQVAPPPAELEELLFQLRAALGGERLQWLCACAIFPALAPPLTLALGQALMPDARAVTLGYSALSALPWFRHGSMPPWLREALLARLQARHEARLHRVIEQRLAAALQQDGGDELASLATARQRAWFAQAGGPARDLLLARFMHRSAVSRLMQRLPQALQRWLFKGGQPWRGWRGGALAGACLPLLLFSLLAASPWWPDFSVERAVPPLRLASPVINAAATGVRGERLAFNADGTLLIGAVPTTSRSGLVSGSLQAWDARTGAVVSRPGFSAADDPPPPQRTAQSPTQAVRAVINEAGLLHLDSAPGQVIGTSLDAAAEALASVVFSPDGRRLAARARDGSIYVWGQPWQGRIELVGCPGSVAVSPELRSLAGRLGQAFGGAQPGAGAEVAAYSAQAWAVQQGQAAPAPGQALLATDAQATAANTIGRWLATADSSLAGQQWYAVRQSADRNALALGVCLQTAPAAGAATALPNIPGLSTLQVRAIDARVAQMFAPDAATRMAATAGLIKDPAVFSDAVTLALQRALAMQTSGKGLAPGEVDGVYNTLVLANAALPATLNRVAVNALALADAASTIGEETRAQAEKLKATLAAGRDRKPRVYVQFSGLAHKPVAERTVVQLIRAGYTAAAAVEDMGAKQPQRAELRVRGLSDRPVARELAALADGALGTRTQVQAINERSARGGATDTYEVWLDAELCRTRAHSACAAVAAAAADTAPPVTAPPVAGPAAGALASAAQQLAGGDLATVEMNIVDCSPALRAEAAKEVVMVALQVQSSVPAARLRAPRSADPVDAKAFTTERGNGLIAQYSRNSAPARRAAEELVATPALRAMGFVAAPADLGEGHRVSVRVCGLPRRSAQIK